MLGKIIKQLRAQNGITQEELGKILSVTTSMVGMYETNARKPSYDVLNKIADYFDVTIDYLLGRTTNPNEQFPEEKPQIRAIARKMNKLPSDKLDLLERLAESMADEADNDKA